MERDTSSDESKHSIRFPDVNEFDSWGLFVAGTVPCCAVAGGSMMFADVFFVEPIGGFGEFFLMFLSALSPIVKITLDGFSSHTQTAGSNSKANWVKVCVRWLSPALALTSIHLLVSVTGGSLDSIFSMYYLYVIAVVGLAYDKRTMGLTGLIVLFSFILNAFIGKAPWHSFVADLPDARFISDLRPYISIGVFGLLAFTTYKIADMSISAGRSRQTSVE